MKKFGIFAVVLGSIISGGSAVAASCGLTLTQCNGQNHLTLSGEQYCLGCGFENGSNRCPNGTKIYAKGARIGNGSTNASWKQYDCNTSTSQSEVKWVMNSFTLGLCGDSQLTLGVDVPSVQNGKKMFNSNPVVQVSSPNGASLSSIDQKPCIKWTCDAGYNPSDDGKSCKISDESECKARSGYGSTWDWVGGKCVCKDASKELKDGQCVSKPRIVPKDENDCNKLGETVPVTWDKSLKDCVCKDTSKKLDYGPPAKCVDPLQDAKDKCAKAGQQWIDNQCKCRDSNKVWNYDRCDETDAARSAREAAEAERQRQINEAAARVKDAYGKLTGMSDSFGISVWKNSEGNFNTSRLASDMIVTSISGIAGGLITNSVVKKNQVKKGFESIGCYVGSDRLADWGDEFVVGRK